MQIQSTSDLQQVSDDAGDVSCRSVPLGDWAQGELRAERQDLGSRGATRPGSSPGFRIGQRLEEGWIRYRSLAVGGIIRATSPEPANESHDHDDHEEEDEREHACEPIHASTGASVACPRVMRQVRA
jgi:hypothetical protein